MSTYSVFGCVFKSVHVLSGGCDAEERKDSTDVKCASHQDIEHRDKHNIVQRQALCLVYLREAFVYFIPIYAYETGPLTRFHIPGSWLMVKQMDKGMDDQDDGWMSRMMDGMSMGIDGYG